jgi:hypothetical protein
MQVEEVNLLVRGGVHRWVPDKEVVEIRRSGSLGSEDQKVGKPPGLASDGLAVRTPDVAELDRLEQRSLESGRQKPHGELPGAVTGAWPAFWAAFH